MTARPGSAPRTARPGSNAKVLAGGGGPNPGRRYPCLPMNASIRRHASSQASAYCSKRRSKNECGAPGTRGSRARRRSVQALVELLHLVDRDRLVLAAEQPEHRRWIRTRGRAARRCRSARRSGCRRSRQRRRVVGEVGGGQERQKPPRQNPTLTTRPVAGAIAQRGDRCGGVGVYLRDLDLLRRAACTRTPRRAAPARRCGRSSRSRSRDGRPARSARRARSRTVQPADVGQDHDPGAAVLGGLCERGGEARAVRPRSARAARPRRRPRSARATGPLGAPEGAHRMRSTCRGE